MNKHKHFSKLALTGLSLILVCTIVVGYSHFIPTKKTAQYLLKIPEKSTVTAIATQLKEEKLIRSSTLFKIFVKLSNAEKKLRAGYFLIPKQTSPQSLIHVLSTRSGNYKLIKVTLPEGFSITEIASQLEKKNICKKEAFIAFVHTQAKQVFKKRYPFLADIPKETIEGYLFPDTYFFKEKEPLKTIVNTMLSEFNTKIYRPYTSFSPKPRFNFHQLLTLASMIEKESRAQWEMSLISSVFHNRLRKRMRLESDPTVVYALGESYKDRVYYKDLETKSPYNTYRVSGFPPTPIASPGEKAFKAACYPEKTNFFFFVAKPDGSHHFSITYKEHLAIQRQLKK